MSLEDSQVKNIVQDLWGAERAEAELAIAKTAVEQLEPGELQELEGLLGGPRRLLTTAHRLGKTLPLGAGGPPGGVVVRSLRALARIEDATHSPEFQSRLQAGDSACRDEWDRLHQEAFPESGPEVDGPSESFQDAVRAELGGGSET